MSSLPTPPVASDAPPVLGAAGSVDAVKIYGQGDATVRALDGVTVSFSKGAFSAIMGPSGSGKSTLMHCLAGLDSLTSGAVYIGETYLATLDDKALTRLRRDKVGFIFQAYNLLPTLTASENITLPLALGGHDADPEWLERVVTTLRLKDRLSHRPSELSGGQQQRVAVGRALVTRPQIIFADEPTGNLDSRSSSEILAFMRQAVDDLGQTIVMVTHDPTAAAYADRVTFLGDGRIVDEMQAPTADRVLDRMKQFGGLNVFKVSLKGIVANKSRMLLTALAVIVATAFLSSTYIFSDTVQKTFDNLFADAFKNTDAYVRSANVIDAGFGQKQRDRIPDTLIAEVRAVPGVAEAEGDVQGFASIIGKDGKPIVSGNTAPPTFGSVALTGALQSWDYVEGQAPSGPDAVAIDKGSADKGKFDVGDRITIAGTTGAREFSLVGIARFGDADSPGGATFSLFDLPTAQEFVGKPGFVDAIQVVGDGSSSDEELATAIADQLPPDAETEVLTGAQITKENQSDIQDSLQFFTVFLNAVAFIALFVSSFVIYNVFSITVAQRKRENALMRAIGASRRQVTVSMLIEAVVIGLVGSILGLGLGVILFIGLQKAFSAIGLDLPSTGIALLPRTIIITIVVGLVVTVTSALLPALRSGRVPPVAAMRDTALESTSTTRGRVIAGAILTVASVVLILLGLFAGTPIVLILGVPLLFIALFVLGPLIARPVAKLLGRPIQRVKGMTGTMAVENAARNPKRTSRTAAALIIGVALVTGVSVLASSIRDSIRDIFGEQFRGDFVISVDNFGFGGLSPQLADDLNQLPEVATATGIGVNYANVEDKGKVITVVDPSTIGSVLDLGFVEGQIGDLTPEGVLLSQGKAKSDGLRVGSPFELTLTDGTPRALTVQGIYKEDDLAGPITVDRHLFDGTAVDQYDFGVFITKAQGVSEAEAEAAIAKVAEGFPNGKLQSRSDYIDSQAEGIMQVVQFIYVLLALSIIIAAVGIVITLVLSVFERRRELGLVRAVGMSRSQVRSSVRWESVITAFLGTVQGVLVGLLLGYAIVVALRDQGLNTFTVPWGAIIFVLVFAFVIGVVAAIYPAHKATKIDILDAIATT